jgi:hypothetical protein
VSPVSLSVPFKEIPAISPAFQSLNMKAADLQRSKPCGKYYDVDRESPIVATDK